MPTYFLQFFLYINHISKHFLQYSVCEMCFFHKFDDVYCAALFIFYIVKIKTNSIRTDQFQEGSFYPHHIMHCYIISVSIFLCIDIIY